MNQKLILDAMVALNATPQRIQSILTIPFHEAVRALEAVKAEARRLYKKVAFEWHPDRNPDDPNAEDRFKALGRVLADLETLRVRPPAPRPVIRFVHFPRTSPFGSSVTYTSATPAPSTTTGTAATGWVKVII